MSDTAAVSGDDIPYENTSVYEWTEGAARLHDRRELLVDIFDTEGVISAHVRGLCPRCGHHLDARLTLTAIVPGLRGELLNRLFGRGIADRPGIPETVDVGCGCGRLHPGAPDAVRGCGVSFRLPATSMSAQTPPPSASPEDSR